VSPGRATGIRGCTRGRGASLISTVFHDTFFYSTRERQFMADVLDVTDQDFQTDVMQSDKPVIIDFWAEWCAPCRQIAPIIKELAETYGDQVKIVKMDIDSNPATPGQFGVRAIPTILAIKNGQVVQQITGARPKADFETMAKDLLS
jgi:thioredoxin 1